jgi:hypothetical protein
MSIRKAYQTLEDRDIHRIESDGPFACHSKNAWLGKGYYFWDSVIDIAHWWGVEGASYQNGYVICESAFELDENKCFNLVDNPAHLDQFNQVKTILKERNLYVEGQTTVARVINYLKEIDVFKFEAIRVYGVGSVGFRSPYSNRTIFIYKEGVKSFQYLDSMPAIQINFFKKDSLNRKGFNIIFPPEYSHDYLV